MPGERPKKKQKDKKKKKKEKKGVWAVLSNKRISQVCAGSVFLAMKEDSGEACQCTYTLMALRISLGGNEPNGERYIDHKDPISESVSWR